MRLAGSSLLGFGSIEFVIARLVESVPIVALETVGWCCPHQPARCLELECERRAIYVVMHESRTSTLCRRELVEHLVSLAVRRRLRARCEWPSPGRGWELVSPGAPGWRWPGRGRRRGRPGPRGGRRW